MHLTFHPAPTQPAPAHGASCAPDTEICVFDISRPPGPDGAIPLTGHALHPQQYPDTDIAAPTTKTKNLIVLAPPANAGITSVTVTTRRDHSTTDTIRTLAPGNALRVCDGKPSPPPAPTHTEN
ncbi:hypothetical protein LQL77_30740 [Rhodococcus cerastii]|nr:hypothetical protein [Rhodococcus cerastii]